MCRLAQSLRDIRAVRRCGVRRYNRSNADTFSADRFACVHGPRGEIALPIFSTTNDAYGFLQVLQSGFGINLPRYANTTYDDLLARAAGESDAGRRRALLENAEQVMIADQPLIPLYFYVAKHLVSARVRGWRDNAMNVVYSKQLAKFEVDR